MSPPSSLYDHVRDRVPFVFEDLGERQVKNIARPVRVYRVRDTVAKSPSPLGNLCKSHWPVVVI